MNTENSKTNEPHRFKLDLPDKLNLKSPNKNIVLVNLSIYYTWKNIKSECNSNKFKIPAPTSRETFDLPDSSYAIDNIQIQNFLLLKYGLQINQVKHLKLKIILI